MKLRIVSLLAVSVVTSFAVQSATASEHRYARAKHRAAFTERIRNSNAYVVPAGQLYGSDVTEGAMTSGIAGH